MKSNDTYNRIQDRYPWLFQTVAWIAVALALALIALSLVTYRGFEQRDATIASLNDSIARAAKNYDELNGLYRDKVNNEQREQREQRHWADSIAIQNDSMAVVVTGVYKKLIDFMCTPNHDNNMRQDHLTYLSKVLSQGLYNKFIVQDAQGKRTANAEHVSSVLFLGKSQKVQGVLRTTKPLAVDAGLFEVENSIDGKSCKVQVRVINDHGRYFIDDVKAI